MRHGRGELRNVSKIGAAALVSLVLLGAFATLLPRASANPPTQSSDPVIFWNQLTTHLAQGAKLNPPRLARAYYLVDVAIYDAVLASGRQHAGDPSQVAVAAGAASVVLMHLFPASASLIGESEKAQAGSLQARNPGVVVSGLNFGHMVGRMMVTHAKNDGSEAVFMGPIPTGDCVWSGVHPVEPMAGTWKTQILTSGAEVQSEAPYPCGSQADLLDVQAVISAHQDLTPERIAIVHKWADILPPTIWNNILDRQIESQGMSVLESARAHAYLNIAMYDAFVSCWLTKYTYWTARPFQRIPGFTPIIPTPNFPGYLSGHSMVSGAASVVMGELFPAQRGYFASQADEAAMSRLWAGIHFPHDNEQGLVVGRAIGAKVVQDMMGAPHTFVFPMERAGPASD